MRAFARWIVVAAAVGMLAACGQKGGAGGSAGATADVMTLGSPDAKVTVREYASTTCPHCARFNEDVFPAFKAKYIDTGKVRYEFHEYLTPPAQVAAAGFLLARCAGQDKYFSVVDALFHSQNEMFTTGDVRGVLFRVGRSAGMTDEQITTCIQDEKALEALNKRVTKAVQDDKVTGTPDFWVNGKSLAGQVLAGQTYQGGEITMAQLSAAVDPLLK